MHFNPHLSFNGQCDVAFRFYEQCLGGKILMMMSYKESPASEQMSPDMGPKIIHATLALGEQMLSGGDVPPESYQKPQGFSLMLHLTDAEEAESIFSTLAENGSVQLPLQATFWAKGFGMLTDQFGIPWAINCG